MSYKVLSLLSLSVESCSIKLCIAVISFIFWAKHYKLADRTSLTIISCHVIVSQGHLVTEATLGLRVACLPYFDYKTELTITFHAFHLATILGE